MLINQFCIVWRKNADEDMAIASAALEIFLIKKVLISARPPPPPPVSHPEEKDWTKWEVPISSGRERVSAALDQGSFP